MPEMTIDQRYQLLTHIWDRIFNVKRFNFMEIFQKKLIPGTPAFTTLVNMFHEHVQRIHLDSYWAPWIGGTTAFARTFNAELPDPNGIVIKAGILIGFDVQLNLGGSGTIVPYPIRVMEQNPFKLDPAHNYTPTAVLAQQGVKLSWVIRNVPQSQLAGESPFLGKIQDGEFIANAPRADSPKTTMRPLPELGGGVVSNDVRQDQYGANHLNNEGEWTSELPDIDPNEVPIGIV